MRWMLTFAVLAVVALLLALSVVDKPRSERSHTPVDPLVPTAQQDEPITPRRPTPQTTRKIEVHVVGAGDEPVQNALVRGVVAGDETARADTDERGRAWIDISAEGRVAVTRCAPYGPALSEPVGDRKTITVHLVGGTLAIAGTIVDEFGNPVEKTIMAKLGDPAPWVGEWHWVGRRVDQPKGRFRIEGLAPGRYRLSMHGNAASENSLFEAGDESVRIVLPSIRWVTVQWIDRATGQALDGVRQLWEGNVLKMDMNGAPDSAVTRMQVAPGSMMQLHATADGYHATQPITIEIGRDERERTLTFKLDPDPGSLAHLTLDVRGEDSAVVKKLMIMRKRGYGWYGTNYESEEGRYEFTLPAGRNKLRFGPLMRSSNDPPYVVERREWTLERAERRTEKVTLRLGGWLRRPVRNAHVEPSTPREDEFIFFARNDERMLLAPGRYVVTAPGPKGTTLSGEITIEAGKIHEVTLR